MELSKDILLRGTSWANAIDKLSPFFQNTTNFSIFMISLSIGILYDTRIDKPQQNGEEPRYVPRNVLQRYDGGTLETMFQASILTTRTIDIKEDERLKLAFDEHTNFDKLDYLTEFANYGVIKLEEQIGDTPVETMERLRNFFDLTIQGENPDIDPLPDEVLLTDFQ